MKSCPIRGSPVNTAVALDTPNMTGQATSIAISIKDPEISSELAKILGEDSNT